MFVIVISLEKIFFSSIIKLRIGQKVKILKYYNLKNKEWKNIEERHKDIKPIYDLVGKKVFCNEAVAL